MCVLSRFSCVLLSATLWTTAHPGSSVHGILQARILEGVAMPSSRGSSQPRKTHVSYVSCTAGRLFTTSTTWEAQNTCLFDYNRKEYWVILEVLTLQEVCYSSGSRIGNTDYFWFIPVFFLIMTTESANQEYSVMLTHLSI